MNPKDIKALAKAAAGLKKHTDTKEAGQGFEYTPPPAGKCVGRFIEYIELGVHGQKPYRGAARKDANEARLVFEFVSPKNIKEIDVEGGKKKIADKFTLNMKASDYTNSKFIKLFEAMRYGRSDIEHFAQMLGEGFIFTVIHNESTKDGIKKTYANIDKDGAWLIEAPFINDPIAETTTPVPVPATLSELTLFIWDLPNQETWDSLYIDGTKTVKDAKGVETEVSKNWIQNKIFTAKNFPGSALEQLLQDGGIDLTVLEGEAEAPEEEVEVEEVEETKPVAKAVAKKPVAAPAPKVTKPTATAAKTTAPTATKPVKAAPKVEAVDPLVALGLA